MRLLLCFIFTSSISIFPLTPLRIDVALARDDAETARRLLQQQLVADSADAAAAYNLGQLHYQAGDFAKASPYFAAAAEQEGAAAQLRLQAAYQQGNALVKQELYHDALRAFEAVIALQPQHEEALKMIQAIKKLLEEQKQKSERSENSEQQEKNGQKNQSPADQNSNQHDENRDSQENKHGEDDNKNGGKDQQNDTKKGDDRQENNQGNQDKNGNEQNRPSGAGKKEESQRDSGTKNNSSDASGLTQNDRAPERPQTGPENKEKSEKKREYQADVAKNDSGGAAASGEAAQKNEKNLKDDTVRLLQLVEGHDNAVAKRILQGGGGKESLPGAGYKNW